MISKDLLTFKLVQNSDPLAMDNCHQRGCTVKKMERPHTWGLFLVINQVLLPVCFPRKADFHVLVNIWQQAKVKSSCTHVGTPFTHRLSFFCLKWKWTICLLSCMRGGYTFVIKIHCICTKRIVIAANYGNRKLNVILLYKRHLWGTHIIGPAQ